MSVTSFPPVPALVQLIDNHRVLYPHYEVELYQVFQYQKEFCVFKKTRNLSFIVSSTFSEYATPSSFSAFSASEFFSSTTFERATDLTYPKIAAPNSVISFEYLLQVLQRQLSFRGGIPNSTDFLPIFRHMGDAFGNRMRSIDMNMKLAGTKYV